MDRRQRRAIRRTLREASYYNRRGIFIVIPAYLWLPALGALIYFAVK